MQCSCLSLRIKDQRHEPDPNSPSPSFSLFTAGRRGLATASSSGGGAIYHTLYKNVFRSNIAYLTYVFAGAIAVEWVYSKGIDTAWELSNSGVRVAYDGWGRERERDGVVRREGRRLCVCMLAGVCDSRLC